MIIEKKIYLSQVSSCFLVYDITKVVFTCYVGEVRLAALVFCVRRKTEGENQRHSLSNAGILCGDILNSRNLIPCVKQAARMVKNKTTPPPPLPALGLAPPNSIDMHSWPGRCKNRLAAPELEMVTEGGLQLLGFWVLPDTSKPASRWGELVRGVKGNWAEEPRVAWMNRPR